MPAAAPVVCKVKVKNEQTLKISECGTKLHSKGASCPNRAQHILPYPTGFCQNKDCEGTARKTRDGKPRKTCSWWKLCPCACHLTYDQMFAMAEMPRQLVDNSGYAPDHSEFQMPTLEERIAMHPLSSGPSSNAPRLVESPAPDLVPATVERAYAPTASGRAAPGELESWVKRECDVWLVEDEGFPCTPAYLAEQVGKTQGIKPPSVGAITAIFNRWVKIGFAEVAAKPARFVKYTEDGIRLGLDGCKARAKRQRRMAEAAAGRRFGRG